MSRRDSSPQIKTKGTKWEAETLAINQMSLTIVFQRIRAFAPGEGRFYPSGSLNGGRRICIFALTVRAIFVDSASGGFV
jgi:hypothetical protein